MWFIKLSTFLLLFLINFQNSSLGSINYLTKRPFKNRRDDLHNNNDIDNHEIANDVVPVNDLKSYIKNRRLKLRRNDDTDISTSIEGQMHWKKEWKLKWANIKKLNEMSNKTEPGDQVYMVAARK